jgi:phage head maturation protease
MKTKDKKTANPYKARTTTKAVKDVDLESRTVTGVFNSYFWIDSDMDMLVPGAAVKSIQERGVGSTKGNRIKHLKDHDWSKNIARIDVLEEREVEIDGREMVGIYHESFYPESQDSTDMLIKIQEGLYDARSIGFQYVKLDLCERNSNDQDCMKRWEEYYPKALNPEKADEYGYFWVVKEIKLWEGSDVSFGANELTPMLGVKGVTKNMLNSQIYGKIDTCHRLFKSGNLSDDGFHRLAMELEQLKSYIATLTDLKPFSKETPKGGPPSPSTDESLEFYKALLNH